MIEKTGPVFTLVALPVLSELEKLEVETEPPEDDTDTGEDGD